MGAKINMSPKATITSLKTPADSTRSLAAKPVPGRYGTFNPDVCPYAGVTERVKEVLEYIHRLQEDMTQMLSMPYDGTPYYTDAREQLDEAEELRNGMEVYVDEAREDTMRWFKGQADIGWDAIREIERVKGHRCPLTRSWYQMRLWRWEKGLNRKSWGQLVKLFDAYDHCASQAKDVRLVHEEGYRFF